jgi:cathepsin B
MDEDDLPFHSGDSTGDIPEWSGASYTPFDARTKWGNCIHPIMNQGSCGSCWAFASTEVLSDRLCIASGGRVNVVLSPQMLVSCDNGKSRGCGGGYPYNAFQYMANKGVPVNSCVPYRGTNGFCPSKCTSMSQSFKKYKCKSGSATKITGITNMMNQIRNYGPIVAIY